MTEEEYVFCGNDPVNFADVNGNDPVTVGALVGASVSGAISGGIGGGLFYLGKVAITDETFSLGGLGSDIAKGAAFGAVLGPVGKILSPYASKLPFLGRLFAGAGDDVARTAGDKCITIGNKLDYFLGKASGNAHNIKRSKDMLRQLEQIGLNDTTETRKYLSQHLMSVFNDSSSIAGVQSNGNVIRESLLMGPSGGLKFTTVWQDNNLVTGYIFGGF